MLFRALITAVALAGCGRSLPFDEPPAPAATGTFVAVGEKGVIVASTDRARWQSQTSPTTERLASVAWGKSAFVAVGAKGTVVVSRDHGAWAAATSGTLTDLTHVIFTGEKFYAVGGDFSKGAAMIASDDGVTWEAFVPWHTSHLYRAVAANGTRVAVAANLKSDLQTPSIFWMKTPATFHWEQSLGPDFNDSVTVNDRMFVVGRGRVGSSPDGKTWSDQTAPADRAIAWSGDLFVLVGENGAVSTSTDGTRWTPAVQTLGKGGWLSGVTAGAGGFVAVGGNGAIVTSADGNGWRQEASPVKTGLSDVAYGR